MAPAIAVLYHPYTATAVPTQLQPSLYSYTWLPLIYCGTPPPPLMCYAVPDPLACHAVPDPLACYVVPDPLACYAWCYVVPAPPGVLCGACTLAAAECL